MKPLKVLYLGWCLFGLTWNGYGDWEVVYPDAPPPAEDLPLLSLGHKANSTSPFRPNYMMGSRSGYVIEETWSNMSGSPAFTLGWGRVGVRKLPFAFDITAVGVFRDKWMLGGAEGQFAHNLQEAQEGYLRPPGHDPVPPIEETWETSRLPVSESISYLGTIHGLDGSVGERIVARAGSKLYVSDDEGKTWKVVEPPLLLSDFIVFRGNAYVIGISPDGPVPGLTFERDLVLYKSKDGENWTLVWSIFLEGSFSAKGGLAILSDAFLPNGMARPEAKRLYVDGYFQSGSWGHPNVHRLQVSTLDGETWLDHDSVSIGYCPSLYCGGRNPWNPLDIPEALRYLRPLDRVPSTDHNYSLDGNTLRYYTNQGYRSNHEWIDGLQTRPLSARDFLVNHTTTTWDGIAAVYGDDHIVSIMNGQPLDYPLPSPPNPVDYWGQLVNAGGTYYLTARVRNAETDNLLYASADLMEWELLPLPQYADAIMLIPMGNALAARYAMKKPDEQPVDSLAYWDGEWSDPVPLPGETGSLVFVPTSQTWYRLIQKSYNKDEQVFVERMTPAGTFEPFVVYKTDAWPGYFTEMACPDDVNLVVYGDTAETLLIKPDGSVQQAHPWSFYPEGGYFVNDVHFINGWYYLCGGANLRTRDFIEYEIVPFDAPMDDVMDDGNALYVSSGDVIYSEPLERGYLQSVEHNQGWRRSDWLGWFLVQDESAGRIYHLLLGETTVAENAPGSYTLNTAALGELSVQAAWMPWLQRVDDGGWYWLDQDSWPGRAWNDAEKTWINLVP